MPEFEKKKKKKTLDLPALEIVEMPCMISVYFGNRNSYSVYCSPRHDRV